jgi:hypothetical protein
MGVYLMAPGGMGEYFSDGCVFNGVYTSWDYGCHSCGRPVSILNYNFLNLALIWANAVIGFCIVHVW